MPNFLIFLKVILQRPNQSPHPWLILESAWGDRYLHRQIKDLQEFKKCHTGSFNPPVSLHALSPIAAAGDAPWRKHLSLATASSLFPLILSQNPQSYNQGHWRVEIYLFYPQICLIPFWTSSFSLRPELPVAMALFMVVRGTFYCFGFLWFFNVYGTDMLASVSVP